MKADISPEQGLLFDLSWRAKLRMTGADRVRFLNGQISNDVRKAQREFAIQACVLNAKGKINADVMIVADGDSLLIDSEPEAREQVAARLERYIIADDVQIEDVTESFALFHMTGPSIPAFAGAKVAAKAERFGTSGIDIWLDREQHDAALQELSMSLPTCDADYAEVLRIERGIPRWGRELTDEIIPTEANLEASAIDYAKGCYIGQEVISRMKMSGQTNKRLCGLLAIGDAAALTVGMRLFAEAKDVGWVTSVAQTTRLGRAIGLGFVKRGFQAPGTRLELHPADGTATSGTGVEVVSLPFV